MKKEKVRFTPIKKEQISEGDFLLLYFIRKDIEIEMEEIEK